MTLHLHIDQISLEGLDIPRSQRPQLQAALEQELSRLLTTQGIPPAMQTGGYISRLPADLTITGKPNPTQLGQQVAQSIYAQLQADSSHSGLAAHPIAAAAPQTTPGSGKEGWGGAV